MVLFMLYFMVNSFDLPYGQEIVLKAKAIALQLLFRVSHCLK